MGDERKRKVWLISSNRWNSAITEYALSSALALQRAGYECTFSPLAGSPAETRSRQLGLTTVPLPAANAMDFGAARRLLLAVRPELVIGFGGPETALAKMLLLTDANTKLVRFRGTGLREGILERLKEKISGHIAQVIVVPGAALGDKLTGLHRFRSVRTLVLGCQSERFHWQDLAAAPRDFLMVGRLDPVKGHRRMMEIYAQFKKRWPIATQAIRPRLHMIGEPANLAEADIHAFAEDLRLVQGEDYLLSCHRVDDIAALMRQALLGVVPSLGSEWICRVAEEFLLVGTPIWVSGVGSLEDCVGKEFGESFGNLGNEDAARLLVSLAIRSSEEIPGDRERRALLAQKKFSLEAMARSWEQLINELFNPNSKS